MPVTTCTNCTHCHYWQWEEAFDKFGFNDGDGQIETGTVVAALEPAGYIVEDYSWGSHNVIIVSIKSRDGREHIPETAEVGYDDPRNYLPAKIIAILDAALPGGGA